MRRWLIFPVLLLLIAPAAWWPPARWTLLLWIPLLLIALYDAVQRHHTLRRNYPLIARVRWLRSEEHTSELQSLMRISYAVFCLKKNIITYQSSRINVI